jgi:hypothetical protein
MAPAISDRWKRSGVCQLERGVDRQPIIYAIWNSAQADLAYIEQFGVRVPPSSHTALDQWVFDWGGRKGPVALSCRGSINSSDLPQSAGTH